MQTDRPRPVRTASVVTFIAGAVLIGTYATLRALDVGKIGDPTDIGGGLILVVGYAVTAMGVVSLARDYGRYRSGRQ